MALVRFGVLATANILLTVLRGEAHCSSLGRSTVSPEEPPKVELACFPTVVTGLPNCMGVTSWNT